MKKIEAQPGQYLTFLLNSQGYGVPIATVREINRVGEITSVPQVPRFVAGVMNLRGQVIPVVNLRVKLGMSALAFTKETCVIVIEGRAGPIGMIVDSVKGVQDLNSGQIEPAPSIGSSQAPGVVMGMGKVEDHVVVLLAIVECLSADSAS